MDKLEGAIELEECNDVCEIFKDKEGLEGEIHDKLKEVKSGAEIRREDLWCVNLFDSSYEFEREKEVVFGFVRVYEQDSESSKVKIE